MWVSWWCAGGGFLRQRVCAIGNVSRGYGEKLQLLDPPLLGIVEVMRGGRKIGGVSPLSSVLNKINRGISTSSGDGSVNNGHGTEDSRSFSEAKKLMRLVNVESLKMKLVMEGKEVICYSELLEACQL